MTPSIAKIEAAKLAITKAETVIREERKSREILCTCGDFHQIGQLKLLVDHFYIQPYGCTDGDYWQEGDWCFVCPVTNTYNQLYFNDYDVAWVDRDKVGCSAEKTFKHLYRGLFESWDNVYKSRAHFTTVRCEYVDKHREEFELPPKKRSLKHASIP